MQVKWFERRANLEPRLKGDREAEREVVELEEIDVNPIGCISGKATVIKARSVDEVSRELFDTRAGEPRVDDPN